MYYYRNDDIPFNCYGVFVKEVIRKFKGKEECVPSLNDISNMWSELSQSEIMKYKKKYEMLVKKKEMVERRKKKKMKRKKKSINEVIVNDDNDNEDGNDNESKECYIEKKGGMMYCYNKELEHAISQSISNMEKRVKSYSKTIFNRRKHVSKIINENDDKSTDISFSNNIITTKTNKKNKRAKSYIKRRKENIINTSHNNSNNNSDNGKRIDEENDIDNEKEKENKKENGSNSDNENNIEKDNNKDKENNSDKKNNKDKDSDNENNIEKDNNKDKENNSDKKNNKDDNNDYTITPKPSKRSKSKRPKRKTTPNLNKHPPRRRRIKICRCGECNICKKILNTPSP